MDKYINRVIHGDCIEVMRGMSDKCVDLVLTDPPYGIGADRMQLGNGKNHKWEKNLVSWDHTPPSRETFLEMERTGENLIVWGGNYFSEHLHSSPHWLIWDKLDPNMSFAEAELAWAKKGKRTRLFRHYAVGAVKVHPTEKPLRLMKWCVECYSSPGDIILDPFCGSGTTLVAAKMLGRRYIGIDIEKKYCDIAEERLRNTTPPLPFTQEKMEQGGMF